MKTCVLVMAWLLLVSCAANPLRCDRRLSPINAAVKAVPRVRVGRP